MNNMKLLEEELKVELALQKYHEENLIYSYFPEAGPLSRHKYIKQIEYMDKGASHMERCMLASNRSGKSLSAAYEVTCHLTGIYPSWWRGRRFPSGIVAWSCAETLTKSFEINQLILLGRFGHWGTGLIPKANIIRTSKRGDRAEIVYVKHISGAVSTLTFKSYDQGVESYQGNMVDVVWVDEECPHPIYGESLIRLTSTVPGKDNGILLITYTPVQGFTELSRLFCPSGIPITGIVPGTNKWITNVTWADVPHLSDATKIEMLAAIPPMMRQARTEGIPSIGEGLVYPIPENKYKCERFAIPAEWYRSFGVDFGYHHPAVVHAAMEPNSKMIYVTDVWLGSEQLLVVLASVCKKHGDSVCGVGDPAGRQAMEELRQLGVKILPGENEVLTGISKVYEALVTGRLKIFSDCTPLFEEMRLYSFDKNGKIKKDHDHLCDSLRYLLNSPTGIWGNKDALMQGAYTKEQGASEGWVGAVSWATQ